MSSRLPGLDTLLKSWPYSPGEVTARRGAGDDGREVLYLRVELGVLQLEVSDRPDGATPDGFATYLECLLAKSESDDAGWTFGEGEYSEIDREFVQYYHRRVAWLALREFALAVQDADHTIALMDFCRAHSSDIGWIALHEQYRPFVLFHRTQAATLAQLELGEPDAALDALDNGMDQIRETIEADWGDAEDFLEEDAIDSPLDYEAEEGLTVDEFINKLQKLRDSITDEYELSDPLPQRLADAVAREEYELAAQLRDQIAQEHRLGKERPRAPRRG